MNCYAQVAKSPNDHQGANVRCKSKSLYYEAQAGAPTVTDAVAMGRSPEFWVTLLIQGIFVEKGISRLEDI